MARPSKRPQPNRLDFKYFPAKSLVCLLAAILASASLGSQSASCQPSDMTIRRAYHTATLLNDGNVLITGGHRYRYDPIGSNTAEIYDAVLRKFRAVGNMATPRNGHLATLLEDGRVLILGSTAGFDARAELYIPWRESFVLPANQPPWMTFRSATRLNDGKVLIVGGEGNYTAALLFNPKTNIFTLLENLPPDFEGSGAAALLQNGKVLFAGGYHTAPITGSVGYVGESFLFDSASRTFFGTGALLVPRGSHSLTGLLDGRALVVGGQFQALPYRSGPALTAELYDPSTGSFSNSPTSPSHLLENHRTAILPNGKIFFIGIACEYFCGEYQIFNPRRNTFKLYSAVGRGGRSGAPLTAFSNGVVMATGGYNTNPQSDVRSWDLFIRPRIDIKPGDDRNTINLRSSALLKAVVFGSPEFDPATIDPTSIELAGARVATKGRAEEPDVSLEDVDHDGRIDLVARFRVGALKLDPGATEALLFADTFADDSVRGADSIHLVP